jgi:hypothetical protein
LLSYLNMIQELRQRKGGRRELAPSIVVRVMGRGGIRLAI